MNSYDKCENNRITGEWMEKNKKDRTRITQINADNYSTEELDCADSCSGSPLDSSRGQME